MATASFAAGQAPAEYTADQLTAQAPAGARPVAVDSYHDIKHPGYGAVQWGPAVAHPLVSLSTTLTVPPHPEPFGTLFLWPGVGSGPRAPHFMPVGNGILQPVLTWGWGCVTQPHPRHHESWWVSGQYVATVGHICDGGETMTVNVGDELDMRLWQSGTVWRQKVTDRRTGRSVTFDRNLGGQEQLWAYLAIETKDQPPAVPIVFRNTVITWSGPSPAMCYPQRMGMTDTMTAPVLSADRTSCRIDRVTLRYQGVR